MIGIVIALAAFAAPQAGQTYDQCLLSVARALEPSGEPADAVAQAAITACGVLEMKPSVNAPGAFEQQQATIATLRDSFRRFVALEVVRIRACRRTAGCTPTSLPAPFKSEVSAR